MATFGKPVVEASNTGRSASIPSGEKYSSSTSSVERMSPKLPPTALSRQNCNPKASMSCHGLISATDTTVNIVLNLPATSSLLNIVKLVDSSNNNIASVVTSRIQPLLLCNSTNRLKISTDSDEFNWFNFPDRMTEIYPKSFAKRKSLSSAPRMDPVI